MSYARTGLELVERVLDARESAALAFGTAIADRGRGKYIPMIMSCVRHGQRGGHRAGLTDVVGRTA